MFSEINAVMPGFINIRLNPCYLASYVQQVAEDEKLGLNAAKKPETIIIDYGGANVAKPLHVGHLRSGCLFHHLIGNIDRFLFIRFGSCHRAVTLILAEIRAV